MSLFPIFIIVLASIVIGRVARGQWRGWTLLIVSLLAIYWLQPGTPIRYLDFWLPTISIMLAILTWAFTRPEEERLSRSDLNTGLIISCVILAIGLMRYLEPVCCLTSTRPPPIVYIFAALLIFSILSLSVLRLSSTKTAWIYSAILLVLVIFIILKSDPLARLVSVAMRSFNSQSTALASSFDIRWLGFSYVAFRLLHTLRDRLNKKLPKLTLQEFVIYVIFFPSLSAGPIDRVQHFVQDLRQPFQFTSQVLYSGCRRILIGIFSKFVLADGLALFALNTNNSSQVQSTGWMWIMLFAYALRIFFDFSGYTDIAIGTGQLLGIQLPENFARPYLKPNISLFWNSWHITLAQWFRAYFFNPLTRTLRSDQRKIPVPLIIFFGQLSTFILIGLWHGISWNFAIWGAWHGIGLFIHNRWSDLVRTRSPSLDIQPQLQRVVTWGSTFLTFIYVALGWVWFALSSPSQSWQVFLKLFGLA